MPNAFNYSNTAVQTTLGGNISGAATTMTVAATTGFPTTAPYVLAIDYGGATEELVVVTSVAGTTLTVTRGFSGTSAQSHSIGAVVRHVVNAQDLIDFRTHEDGAADVHGVTGALVGATQVQTLTNKTLTSPTINDGALSGTFTGAHAYADAVTLSGGGTLTGTFTGSPTFSGAPTFTGGVTVSGLSILVERDNTTDNAYRARLTGDTNSRFLINADGSVSWGAGTGSTDTTLYRDSASTLATDDRFLIRRSGGTDDALSVRQSGDTNSRFMVQANGVASWGTGDTPSLDTSLYRASAGVLQTDGDFHAAVFTSSSGITAASGFTLDDFDSRSTCGVMTIHATLTRTGATITANAEGNITNTACGTLSAGWRPSTDMIVAFDKGSVATGTMLIASSGTCTLYTLSAGAEIASSDSVSFTATFVQ